MAIPKKNFHIQIIAGGPNPQHGVFWTTGREAKSTSLQDDDQILLTSMGDKRQALTFVDFISKKGNPKKLMALYDEMWANIATIGYKKIFAYYKSIGWDSIRQKLID